MAESMSATNGVCSHPPPSPPPWLDGAQLGAEPSAPATGQAPVLYLVHRVPYPPDKGDRIRNWNVLRGIARHAPVHLACLADEPVSDSTLAALNEVCARVGVVSQGATRWVRGLASLLRGHTVTEGVFWAPALARLVRQWASEVRYHTVLASASSMVAYLELPELRALPTVVDLVDVDSEKWLDYAVSLRGWRSWLYHTEGWRLRKLETRLPERVRSVVLVSEAEANLYRHFAARGSIHSVTSGVELDYFQPMHEAEERRCVFVGALNYYPNVEGANWFCEDVWPELHRRHPDLNFDIVGRRPGSPMKRLARLPGVNLIGQVPDVRPYLARGAIAVVPVRIARGIQSKVLEALAMGKAVVATPQTTAGLKAQHGVHLLVASTAREWVEALERLLHDPELRQRLGAAGRRYVEEHHRWERCLQPFQQLLGLPDHV